MIVRLGGVRGCVLLASLREQCVSFCASLRFRLIGQHTAPIVEGCGEVGFDDERGGVLPDSLRKKGIGLPVSFPACPAKMFPFSV